VHPPSLQQLRFPEAPAFTFLDPFAVSPSARSRVPPARRPEVLDLAASILRHDVADSPLRLLQIRVLLMRLILAACEEWSSPESRPADELARPRNIEPALKLVAESRRFLAVSEAARACDMSVKVFRSAFRTLMGVSLPDYALKYRVDGVALQLLQSEDPVKAIAVDWGFSDTSHLDHTFKRFYGHFPMEYRRLYSR
jgi:AraC-like DNA-binding protein